jgi:hypothetical protein
MWRVTEKSFPVANARQRLPSNAPASNVGGRSKRDIMLLDRQRFVLAVHQALKEHDEKKNNAVDSGGHDIAIDCDNELEQFADRILELMD